MNSKKRIITGILASAFAAAPMTGLSAKAMVLPEEVTGTRYSEPVQILAALKIMVGDDDGAFRLEDNLKRSEVAKMAIHALGLEDAADSAKGETKYPDVSADHWANGYINLATSQGLIIGDDVGTFRPDDSITYAEATAIFVRALGYDVMAESKGGYPNGHFAVGGSIGLTKNVQGSYGQPITRGNIAFLANNSLTIGLMERKGYGTDATYEVTEKTLLKDKLKTEKLTGQVKAIPATGLEGDSNLNDNEIKIGDNVYETAYNMNNLLGYNVTYYVQEDDSGDNTVILAMPQKDQNATADITADLFEQLTTKNGKKAIEYFEKSDSSKTTTVSIEDNAKLIYNGKVAELSDELLNLKDKSGKITLLDTDRNGVYDIVFVTNYYNIVVEEVTSTGKIVDKYGAKTIKLGEDEDVSYRIVKGLQEVKLSDLKEYDVLSVAESKDGELFDIALSNETVTGKITGKKSDSFIIGGKEYKVAKNYPDTLEIGTEGIFYLDVENKIAAVDTQYVTSDNYGYLIKAYYSDESEKATFRIFTKDGEDKTFTANDKIRFNGTGGIKSQEVVNKLNDNGVTTKQLITYTANSEGRITEVFTSIDNTASGAAVNGKFTLDYSVKDAVYNQKLNKLGNVRINDDTKIFDIQDDVEDYSMAKPDMFEDKQKYNVMIFDTTEEFTAKAVVVTGAEFQTNAEASVAVVSGVGTASNADDEITDKLFAYIDGKEVEVLAESTGILVKGNEKKELEIGDIIQYKTNDNGEIVKIRVLFDISAKNTEFNEVPVEDLEILYGKVSKKFSGSINVTVNGGAVRNVQLPSDVKVYSVDSSKTKNNVTVGTAGDIQAYDADEGNRVFIRFYDDVVKEVVIIK